MEHRSLCVKYESNKTTLCMEIIHRTMIFFFFWKENGKNHLQFMGILLLLDELQVGIKIAKRSNNLKYAHDTTSITESEEELKSFLMRVKEGSEIAGLKLSTQKIMAFGSITSWQIDGEIMETVANFIFLGSKISVDDNCSHEIKRRLLLGRKL